MELSKIGICYEQNSTQANTVDQSSSGLTEIQCMETPLKNNMSQSVSDIENASTSKFKIRGLCCAYSG